MEKRLRTAVAALVGCVEAAGVADEALLAGTPLSFALNDVRGLLTAERASPGNEKLLTAVLNVIVPELGGSIGGIMGRRKTRQVSLHRQLVCYALRSTELSFPEIGSLMGLDHSTVQHAVRKIEILKDRGELTGAQKFALDRAIKAVSTPTVEGMS
jgi:chromosomal replication initiation ATPase DnaA